MTVVNVVVSELVLIQEIYQCFILHEKLHSDTSVPIVAGTPEIVYKDVNWNIIFSGQNSCPLSIQVRSGEKGQEQFFNEICNMINFQNTYVWDRNDLSNNIRNMIPFQILIFNVYQLLSNIIL